jgi:predicted acyltransferase
MIPKIPSGRLLSLDAFRGITMLLLMAEAAFVYGAVTDYVADGSIGAAVISQFHHHPWNGLRFWDLIQPFFMFIVGVAMPFSLAARQRKGASWNASFRHILRRCFLLLSFGVGLHWVYSGQPVWELWNVLTQLSFTVLITFLILGWDWKKQLAVAIACLLLTELLYRGYDATAPFIKDQNFGSWFDLLLMGKINGGGGWVTINCLPTAAHTVWGAMCGKLLMDGFSPGQKIR